MKTRKMYSMVLVLIMAISIFSVQGAFALDMGKIGEYNTISAGETHTLAIKADGTLWGWGRNYYGELGLGYKSREFYPDQNYCLTYGKPNKIMDGVISANANNSYSMAIKTDNTLWAWGDNNGMFLGVGDGAQATPVRIMDDVKSVSIGGQSFFVIKCDNSLWSWGENKWGQLGNGGQGKLDMYGNISCYTATKIMDNVAAVRAGPTQTFAIKTDGSLWAWGDTYQNIPTKVMDDIKAVSAGSGYVMVIKSDNSLWGWGDNPSGQIGNGDTEIQSTPIKIMDDVVSVSAGRQHTIAIKNDGSLWSWGDNYYGQLGNGNNKLQYTPTKVMDGVASISAGKNYTEVIKSDGSLWAFGSNHCGQLGNGGVGNLDLRQQTLPQVDPEHFTSFEVTLDFTDRGAGQTVPVKIMDGMSLVGSIFKTAIPSPCKVLITGQVVTFDAYVIDGNNYMKLRDVAKAINGTDKQFNVTWDGKQNAINIISNTPYSAVGGEMAAGDGMDKVANLCTATILLNGQKVELTGYTIGQNNYFKLRDLGSTFDFGVDWDGATNTVIIDTSKSYSK